MAVCAICKTGGLGHRDGLFFHACDDWGHHRLFLCPKCLEDTPLQRSAHEQCHECSDAPQEVKGLASEMISPRFHELFVAIVRFEDVHRELLANVPFVSRKEDPDGSHPGSLNTPFLKPWLQKYGGDDCVSS